MHKSAWFLLLSGLASLPTGAIADDTENHFKGSANAGVSLSTNPNYIYQGSAGVNAKLRNNFSGAPGKFGEANLNAGGSFSSAGGSFNLGVFAGAGKDIKKETKTHSLIAGASYEENHQAMGPQYGALLGEGRYRLAGNAGKASFTLKAGLGEVHAPGFYGIGGKLGLEGVAQLNHYCNKREMECLNMFGQVDVLGNVTRKLGIARGKAGVSVPISRNTALALSVGGTKVNPRGPVSKGEMRADAMYRANFDIMEILGMVDSAKQSKKLIDKAQRLADAIGEENIDRVIQDLTEKRVPAAVPQKVQPAPVQQAPAPNPAPEPVPAPADSGVEQAPEFGIDPEKIEIAPAEQPGSATSLQ